MKYFIPAFLIAFGIGIAVLATYYIGFFIDKLYKYCEYNYSSWKRSISWRIKVVSRRLQFTKLVNKS